MPITARRSPATPPHSPPLAGAVAGAFNALPAAPGARPSRCRPRRSPTPTCPTSTRSAPSASTALGVFHAGLPNSGIMYCGPTAAMNVLAFLADHGATDDVARLQRLDRSPPTTRRCPAKLNELGGLMGTDAQEGHEPRRLPERDARRGAPGTATAKHQFGLVSEFPGDDNDWQAPNLGIAAFAEAVGNPVDRAASATTRRSSSRAAGNSEFIGLRRTGGHFVTMTGFDNERAQLHGSRRRRAGSFAQSAYANQHQPVTPVTTVYMDSNGNPYRSDLQTETLPAPAGLRRRRRVHRGLHGRPAVVHADRQAQLPASSQGGDVRKIKTADPGPWSPTCSCRRPVTPPTTRWPTARRSTSSTWPPRSPSRCDQGTAPVTSLAVSTKGDTIYAAAGRQLSAVVEHRHQDRQDDAAHHGRGDRLRPGPRPDRRRHAADQAVPGAGAVADDAGHGHLPASAVANATSSAPRSTRRSGS